MYMLWGGGAPFTRGPSPSELRDASGAAVKLLGVSGQALDEVKTDEGWGGTRVSWVSCTDEPSWAEECMEKFLTPAGARLVDRVDLQMIYKADKQTHFRELARETGLDYEEMLFFDNEKYNVDSVKKLGVKCVYCPQGLTLEAWQQGLGMFE